MKYYYSKKENGFVPESFLVDGLYDIGSLVLLSDDELSIFHPSYGAIQPVGKCLGADENGCPAWVDEEAKPPSYITMRQARLILHRQGLLSQVQAAIDSLEEPAKTEAQIEWDYATTVHRDSEIMRTLATALALDDGLLDSLFMEASIL